MIVAIASTTDDIMTADVSQDIGRSPYFIVYDTETEEWYSIGNEHRNKESGLGIAVTRDLVSLEVDAAIVGGIGPHGYSVLSKAGVLVSSDEEGSVTEALRAFERRHPTAVGSDLGNGSSR